MSHTHPEKVYAIFDTYDGPVTGVADFAGKPHAFARNFDEASDEYTSIYRLAPISPRIAKLSQECIEIFNRWNNEFKKGNVDISSHPALPAERARHAELFSLINKHLGVPTDNSIRRQAEFSIDAKTDQSTVIWKPVKG